MSSISAARATRIAYSHRLAHIGDLQHIVEIYNSTVPTRVVTADTEPVSIESRHDWFAEHSHDRRPLWVVEHEGRIAGWLSFSNFYGRPAYFGTAEISIYIHEEARCQGLGTYLLETAMAHAPEINVHTLLGFIFGHNDPSLKLFERAGFERWASMPRVATLDGVDRDLIIMGKRVV